MTENRLRELIRQSLSENSANFPHEIKSERYWRQILAGNEYGNKVLDTIMKRQGGFASQRQMDVLRRIERGDKGPYPTKN